MTTRAPAFTRLALAAALIAAAGTAAAQATPDARLLAAAEAAKPAVVEHLRELVSIESGSADVEGLAKMADHLEAWLKALGASVERRKATAGAGADIVIGTFRGTGQRKVMLQGHMDTVYSRGTLAQQPFKTEGTRLYGPGIADDKGGLAVIFASLKILADAGWKDYETLTVLVNPDEEVGSIGSGELIAATADRHDVVLSYEPSNTQSGERKEILLLGAAGTATATLEVKGRASHAGAAPEEGRNALVELSHQIVQSHDVARGVPGTLLNWTGATAAGPRNQIPENARATADVRITVPGAERALDEALKAKVAATRLVPDTTTTVRIDIGRPAFQANAAGRALAQRGQAIYAELGRELQLVPMAGGATDAAYAGRSGKAVVVESFGLAGAGYHARDEYIDMDSIVPRLYLSTRMLMDIGKAPR